jgi:hypothetical protein
MSACFTDALSLLPTSFSAAANCKRSSMPCSCVFACQFGAQRSAVSLQVVKAFQVHTYPKSTSRFPQLDPSRFRCSYGTSDHTFHISFLFLRFCHTRYIKSEKCSRLPFQNQSLKVQLKLLHTVPFAPGNFLLACCVHGLAWSDSKTPWPRYPPKTGTPPGSNPSDRWSELCP